MTREEAIARIKDHMIVHKMHEPRAVYISEALDMAIQALSQEPILDKLTEIIEPLRHLAYDEMSDVEWQILQVIDKYAEQEPYICDTCKHKGAGWDTEPCDGCCGNHSGYEPCEKNHEEKPHSLLDAYFQMRFESCAEQEPCEDAISRQAVLDLIADYDLNMGQVVKGVHELPPVTPKTKTGHWKHFAQSDDCSLCGYSTGKYGSPSKFCPNCGAEMVGEKK